MLRADWRTVLSALLCPNWGLQGVEVYEPFEGSGEGAKTQDTQGPGWAYRVGQSDFKAVRWPALDCTPLFPPAQR